jgi:hypothetical protein
MALVLVGVLLAASLAFLRVWLPLRAARRADYIRTFLLPKGLYEKLQKTHPQLSMKDCELVGKGLRQFFLTYLKSGKQYVSMPSQVVDDLWHEYILYTRNYEQFCQAAFGRFLHHTPAAVIGTSKVSNSGLRRCWTFACKEELINPKSPSRLPLLFALDTKLGIAGGFNYSPNCARVPFASQSKPNDNGDGVIYCGSDFSDASFDGGLDGFDGIDGSGDASGDGGGGGDGGCGGGGD